MVTKILYRTATALCCGALILSNTVPIANAQEQLVQINSTTAVMPGPGHSSQWTTQITPTSPKNISLGLNLEAASADKTGLLELLTVSITDNAGHVVLAPTLASNISNQTVPLGNLADSQMNLIGTVALDASANNQYQDVSSVVDFQIVATTDDTPTASTQETRKRPKMLAYTGFALTGLLIAAGLAFLLGVIFRTFRERRK